MPTEWYIVIEGQIMNVSIPLSEPIAKQLQAAWQDMPSRMLRAIAIEAYTSGAITEFEVQQMLGLSSRWAVDEILKQSRAYIDYSEADLINDVAAIRLQF